jgi:hypothetical protein
MAQWQWKCVKIKENQKIPGSLPSPDRVTRLGDFSHNGRLFTLGSFFFKIKVVAQIFSKFRTCINFDQKCFGLHFGSFFQKLIWSN